MAIAIFDDQQTRKGQKLGISTFEAWGARFVMFCAATLGAYHIGNILTVAALPSDPHIVAVVFVFAVGFGLAYSEAVTSKSVYANEQPKGAGRDKIGRLKLLLILIVASCAGGYSFHINTERDDIKSASYGTYESSFDDQAAVLLSDRNAARATAKTSAERSTINSTYNRGMMDLKREKSKHQATKPVIVADGEKWIKTFGYALFSLFCSSMLISFSQYLCKYYRPLIAFPFVGFQDKENESWNLEQAHGGSIEIDLTKSKKIKIDSGLPVPPIEFADTSLSNPRTNRPALDESRLEGVSGVQVNTSDRTLNTDTQKGAKVEYSDNHYQTIKEGIVSGDINPTQRPVRTQLVQLNVRFVDDAERARKASSILDQLADERVLIVNPDFGNSKKVVAKYIVNSDAKEGDGTSLETETAGTVCKCPKCGKLEEVTVTNPDGKVRSTCGFVYVAENHAVN